MGAVVADGGVRTESTTAVASDPEPALDLEQASVAGLVRAAASGQDWAWQQLVGRFGGLIASVGWRYGLSAADVSELQQTTWLRLVEHIDRIRQPERVGGWLATTARRESLQILRRAGRYTTGVDDFLSGLPSDDVVEPDAGPVLEEHTVALRAAWSRLKPRCQRLLSLLIADDATAYRDLSTMLDMPIGSIGPTRARCLEHLRRLVEEEGVTSL